jgi:hypothetical protein
MAAPVPGETDSIVGKGAEHQIVVAVDPPVRAKVVRQAPDSIALVGVEGLEQDPVIIE